MLVRLCALWLVVLAALPFTAPFAVLHLSDFLGQAQAQRLIDSTATPAASSPQTDDADDVSGAAAFVQRGDPGLAGLAPVATPAGDVPLSASSAVAPPVASTPPAPDALAFSANLRL